MAKAVLTITDIDDQGNISLHCKFGDDPEKGPQIDSGAHHIMVKCMQFLSELNESIGDPTSTSIH